MLPLHAYIPSFPLLILLLFSIVLPLIAAGFIAEDVWDKDRFYFEEPFMLWVNRHLGGWLTFPSLVLHHIGKASVATPITLLFAAWFYLRRQRGYAVFVVLAALLPTVVMSVAKRFFGRARPELWPRIVEESSASFPSGHSTFAAALATMIVLIYWQRPRRKTIAAAAAAFALMMGFSRIVLGVHYPTDVLVGWITGMSISVGLYLVLFRRLPGGGT